MFLRRRFFRCYGSYRSLNHITDAFRRVGIIAWKILEYDEAFNSLVSSNVAYPFNSFDIMCIESEGDEEKINEIAAQYSQTIYETDKQFSRTANAYVDAMCELLRIPGIWIMSDNYHVIVQDNRRKRYHLNHLLGIESLKDFTGWIVNWTTSKVRVCLHHPAVAMNKNGFTVEFPISSCPVLRQEDSSKSKLKKEPSLLANEDDSQLRPYQSEQKANILQAWSEAQRVMFQMPTGTGKTRLFVSLIRDIKQQQPKAHILIVAHRTELIEQISYSLSTHYGLNHGILGTKEISGDQSILVASIQRLSRRIGKDERLTTFDYIIIDEAHHSLAPTYKKLIEAYPKAKVLGVTATPYRLKKASFTTLYDTLVESQPMRQFIAEGYLANYRLFTVSDRTAAMGKINRLTKFGADGDYKSQDLKDIFDTETEIQQLYDCYSIYAAGKKGIIYAVSRDHAVHIATLFNNKGIKAASIDCDTPKEERQRLIDEFKANDGGLQVLVNVELFTEGFDCPSIEFVMLARPTRSLTLYLQQVGRALRPTPNGNVVLILDCVGLYNRFGLPERNCDWQSHFKGVKPKNEDHTKRPLGTSSVNGLMKEVKRQRKEIVHTDGEFSIYTTDNIKYGICDKSGRTIFYPLYEKITPTHYGWYIGYRNERNRQYQDVLSPSDAKTYPFRNISQETVSTYAAELIESSGINVLAVRFDKSLHLLPTKTIKVGTKSNIFLHDVKQSGKSFYTTNLALDALIYSDYIKLQSGVFRLKGFNCSDAIIADNNISQVCKGDDMYEGDYLVTRSSWRISPDGTVYWPVHGGFPLRYTKDKNGITLYDGHFSPLLHGDSIEVFNNHCVIKRASQPPLTITILTTCVTG